MPTTNSEAKSLTDDSSKAQCDDTTPDEELRWVTLTATVDVSDFIPPRRLYIKSQARETERRFLEAIGVDEDAYETTVHKFPPAIEKVTAEHVVDTSDMTATETAHVREMARKYAEAFRREVRILREKYAD